MSSHYVRKTIGPTPDLVEYLSTTFAASEKEFDQGQAKKKDGEAKQWLIDNGHVPRAVQGNEKYKIEALYP